ncbi:CU044_5270 family protein [Actinomadura algeriensis]|uniref:CU044_5270 family protein n=1 Tax=Actinomadura algeriensis TaxID=1679523 RepID=A0ABR9JWC5_9ACTN|nr:CU044_5270 family protein [Actinomadura algeriensis]MBE1534676.1 hypothetical protein [Actinomadura algeriensis]
MDEMQRLQDRYDAIPDPGPRSVAAARARLDARMDGTRPAGRARRVRPAWGLSLAAAGAAAALAVATVVAPGDDPAARPPAAQTVLLAAADKAAEAPADGKYWHVETVSGGTVLASWTTRDGRRWVGHRTANPEPGTPATELKEVKGPAPMGPTVLGDDPSMAELRDLPTDPKALRALASSNVPEIAPDAETGAAPITRDGYVVDALVGLITDQPVPPKVRAAAFRALAATPGVKTEGEAHDELGRKGVVLTYAQRTPQSGATGVRLIIDPNTARVHAERITADAKKKGGAQGEVHYLEASWTDEAPAVPKSPRPETRRPQPGVH